MSITEEMLKKIEDQIVSEQREFGYDTKEYTVKLLVLKLQINPNEEDNPDKDLFIPRYQRKDVWTNERKSKFIESVMMGLPIPYIFTADTENGKMEVMDGSQRLLALKAFIENSLSLSKLKKLTLLNGLKYKDLPLSQQIKFSNRAVRMIVFSDKTDPSARQDIFERINTRR